MVIPGFIKKNRKNTLLIGIDKRSFVAYFCAVICFGSDRKREGAMDGKWFFIYRKLIKNTWKVKIRTFGAKDKMFGAKDVFVDSKYYSIRSKC